jgi:hypothetical protein
VAAVEAILTDLDAHPERVRRLTSWGWIIEVWSWPGSVSAAGNQPTTDPPLTSPPDLTNQRLSRATANPRRKGNSPRQRPDRLSRSLEHEACRLQLSPSVRGFEHGG